MLNLTLVPELTIAEVESLAEYQAKRALACGRRKDTDGFAVHANKMYDILAAARYPRLSTQALVRNLGRGKAMVLQIERDIINLAL